MSKTFRATAILVGTTIGAGIFGIPYVISKVGFLPGIFYILTLGLLTLLLNLVYGEIILRTPGDHQLTGYGKIYLRKTGRILAVLSLFLTIYGALLAYLIKVGEFLSLFLGFGNPYLLSILFFIFVTIAIVFGLRTISFLEGLIVFLLVGLVFLLTIFGFGKIDFSNFSGANLSFLFLPYGVILFALSGSSVIPEMEEILREKPQNLRKSIIVGTLIPIFVYILFASVVFGISGSLTSNDAISGLRFFLPSWIVMFGALLGIFSMGSSYLSLGYVLREVWYRDFKLSKAASLAFACIPSFVLFLLGAKNFIGIIGISGAVFGGLNGILIVSIYEKAIKKGRKKPAYSLNIPKILIIILFLIFCLGMISPFLKL